MENGTEDVVAPVVDEVAAPAESPALVLDLSSTCSECGQKYSGCHDRHVKVSLSKLLIINGIKYGPGEALVPEEADALWRTAL